MADNKAPSIARHRVAAVCPTLEGETSGVASLLTSEIVTNAVLHPRHHGSEKDPHITVRIQCSATRLRVEVHDGDKRDIPSPGLSARGLAEHGRGLHLVASLASDWGSDLLPHGGKSVWFELHSEGEEHASGPPGRTPGSSTPHERLFERVGPRLRWLRVQLAQLLG